MGYPRASWDLNDLSEKLLSIYRWEASDDGIKHSDVIQHHEIRDQYERPQVYYAIQRLIERGFLEKVEHGRCRIAPDVTKNDVASASGIDRWEKYVEGFREEYVTLLLKYFNVERTRLCESICVESSRLGFDRYSHEIVHLLVRRARRAHEIADLDVASFDFRTYMFVTSDEQRARDIVLAMGFKLPGRRVHAALSRLAKQGLIRAVQRGVYVVT